MTLLKKKLYFLLGLAIGLTFLVSRTLIIVPEGHTGLLLDTQAPQSAESFLAQKGRLLPPGLHFKKPFFGSDYRLFDNRTQSLTFTYLDIPITNDKTMSAEYYINWRLTNPIRYCRSFQEIRQAHRQLIQEVKPLIYPLLSASSTSIESSQLNKGIITANQHLQAYGIAIIDIGFKALKLSPAIEASLLQSNRLKQENIAQTQRIKGKENAKIIYDTANATAQLILEKAKEEAAKIRAKADATAAKIYNKAYQKNIELATFYLYLETYKKALNQTHHANFLALNLKDFKELKKADSLCLDERNR